MPDLKIVRMRSIPAQIKLHLPFGMPDSTAPKKIPIKLDSSWIMEGTIVAQQPATGEAIKSEVQMAQGTPSQPPQAQIRRSPR